MAGGIFLTRDCWTWPGVLHFTYCLEICNEFSSLLIEGMTFTAWPEIGGGIYPLPRMGDLSFRHSDILIHLVGHGGNKLTRFQHWGLHVQELTHSEIMIPPFHA